MFATFKASGLYKSLSKRFSTKLMEERRVEEDATIKQKEKINPSYPDAIWHRSKSARFRQN